MCINPGGHACRLFPDIICITPRVAHGMQTGVAPDAHGPTIFASQLVARIIAEQGSSNSGAGMKNDSHPGEICLYLQDFLRISHGCHERVDRGAVRSA